ncbi:hypothetical protein BKA70DRAFT_1408512 [Coprinopsis sp. MPI-PUGE-AT-0042]|nr:hypothetical protein BKA70DRAFT_1408512 [Coprinopsis sp. MPI-PUGE-AT-0042]
MAFFRFIQNWKKEHYNLNVLEAILSVLQTSPKSPSLTQTELAFRGLQSVECLQTILAASIDYPTLLEATRWRMRTCLDDILGRSILIGRIWNRLQLEASALSAAEKFNYEHTTSTYSTRYFQSCMGSQAFISHTVRTIRTPVLLSVYANPTTWRGVRAQLFLFHYFSQSLTAIGCVLFIEQYVGGFLVIMTPGVVIQLVMCLYALRTLQRTPTSEVDGKRRLLLVVSFIIWVIYSSAVLIEVWNIACRMLGRDAYPPWSIGLNTALTLTYMCIGDCLMLWRCCGIWNGKRWVVLVPVTTFLTYLAFGIVTVINSVTRNLPLYASVLSIASSVTTNVVITSLIVHKLLVARREIIKSEMYESVPRFYRDLILILIESAAPLALAGLCAVAASAARLSNRVPDKSMKGLYLSVITFDFLFLLFGALSPQMILCRTLACLPNGLAVLATEESQTESDVGAVFNTQSAHFPLVQSVIL